jgi:hypothetical protein
LVPGARTQIKRAFNPGMIQPLKQAVGRDMAVGGAGPAGQSLSAGLVGELQLSWRPHAVEGG